MIRTRAIAALAPVLLLLVPLGVGAQEEGMPIFRDVVDVRVVNLEVVVTDRQGNRVTGLSPEQFRLFVDGEEVPIDYFTEIRGGRAVEPTDETTVRGVPALVPGAPVGTNYLVFIDEFFSLAKDRDRVVRTLIDELDYLHPEDRMAVVAYNGERLEMLTAWSGSPHHLRRTLQGALERPTHGLRRIAEQRDVRDATRNRTPEGARRQAWDTADEPSTTEFLEGNLDSIPAFADVDAPDFTTFERLHISRLERQVEAITKAAAATLRSFANPPGRRVMMVLSGGWPYSPAGFLMGRSPGEFEEHSKEVEELYGPLADTANRLGYTLYTVDVPASPIAFPAVEMATQTVAEHEDRDPQVPVQRGFELRYTLQFIAERTGGEALIGGQRELALGRVVEDTRSYYWLGFTPSWREDDRSREISVEVDRPDVLVRSRSSFLDLSRESSVGMVVESALLFGSPPQPHPLLVRLGDQKRSGRRSVQVPVSLAVPVDAVAFLPRNGEYVADLELRLAVRDEAGRAAAEIEPIPFQVKVGGEPQAGAYFRYDTAVELRNQPHRIVVAVYDKVGGAVLSGVTEFRP